MKNLADRIRNTVFVIWLAIAGGTLYLEFISRIWLQAVVPLSLAMAASALLWILIFRMMTRK